MTGGPPPFRPGEGQSSWILLRQEAEIRTRLERLRSGLADPALNRVVEGLARPDVVRQRLSALALSLEEALRTLGTLHAELTHPFETRDVGPGPARTPMEGDADPAESAPAAGSLPGGSLPPGMQEILDRFMRQRSRAPGFGYTLEHDAMRGWVIRWKEVARDGSVVASGRLDERPWKWMPAPSSGSPPRL
jgi:hypothetical protein